MRKKLKAVDKECQEKLLVGIIINFRNKLPFYPPKVCSHCSHHNTGFLETIPHP